MKNKKVDKDTTTYKTTVLIVTIKQTVKCIKIIYSKRKQLTLILKTVFLIEHSSL